MPMMTFDLEDGKPPVSFSINGEGALRFMVFMNECQEIVASKNKSGVPSLTGAEIDERLDAVLRASGSALRHYTMPKTLTDMRTTMRSAIEKKVRGEG